MADPNASSWPWRADAAPPWARAWPTVFQWAPQALSQPILPGWTFNINSQNSSAPQTEAEIVQKHSYGRQLGRIADALSALIEAQKPGLSRDPRLVDFREMTQEIAQVKLDAAEARVQRLLADLAALKSCRDGRYERLRDALREALD